MQIALNRLEKLRRVGQKFGPYLILEMLLPGGTLVALLLFLCRDGRLDTAGIAARAGLAVARTLKQGFGMLRPFCALARACLSSRRTRHVRRRFFVGIVTTRLSISGPAIRL